MSNCTAQKPNSIKRGQTFKRQYVVKKNGVALDLTGYSISSKICKTNKDLVTALSVVYTDLQNGRFDIPDTDTSNWPLGELIWDIKFVDPNGVVKASQTFSIFIEWSPSL